MWTSRGTSRSFISLFYPYFTFFHASGDFLRHLFLKSGKTYTKMQIEKDLENENQLKRMRKPPTLIDPRGITDHWPKKLRNILACLTKVKNAQRKRRFSKMFLIQNLRPFFTFWLLLFRSLKTKITSCQTLRRPYWFRLSKFCVTIIATNTQCEHQ